MSYNIEFSVASSNKIEAALCKRVEEIRLSRNITQSQLAKEAGISARTVGRFEKGKGVSFDTFIRIMKALGIQQSLEALLPDPNVQPIQRVGINPTKRKRASSSASNDKPSTWKWGDGADNE